MKYFLILIAVCTLISCRSVKQVNPDLSKSYLKFGSQGGITGNGNYYLIFDNGDLISFNTLDKKYLKQKSLKSDIAKSLFQMTKSCGFLDLKFNAIGNMTYKIESQMDGKMHSVTWTDQDKASDAVLNLYKELNQTIVKK